MPIKVELSEVVMIKLDKNCHLCVRNLLLGHLTVACKFSDFQPVWFQPLAEVSDHLLDQGLHRSDVDHFEFVCSNGAVFLDVFTNLSENGQHGHVRFSGTGRSAEQHVLVRVETNFGQLALDPVKLLETLESTLSIRRQRLDRDELKFSKNKKARKLHRERSYKRYD